MDPRNLRIGQGYDVHQLVEGRKLIMGGVDIPHTRGLLGHSDADVLAHAVSDALLGAVRGGDIGKLFPRRRQRHRGPGAEAFPLPRSDAREPGARDGHLAGKRGREGDHD